MSLAREAREAWKAGKLPKEQLRETEDENQAGDPIINKAVYTDCDAFMADVIAIYGHEIQELGRLGCSFIQIDECALPVLCDPKNRERVKARGESPEANVDFYVGAVIEIARGRPVGQAV